MSIHKSLVPRSKLVRHRNVLSRAERIKILLEEGKWKESDSVFGLPKVKHILRKARAKPKKEEAAATAAATAVAGTPAATTTSTATTKPGTTPAKQPTTSAPTPTPEKKAKERGEPKK